MAFLKLEGKYININQFEDEFGNLKEEYEIIAYTKLADGQWIEEKRFESGRNHFVIDNQLYFTTGNSLIKLNMDFDSKTCGACFEIGNKIENKKKITGNEILFTCISATGEGMSLHKQSYSDSTCFYTLQDGRGNWKVEYGNRDLKELIKQLEHELKIHEETANSDCIMSNPAVQLVYDGFKKWKVNIIENMHKQLTVTI